MPAIVLQKESPIAALLAGLGNGVAAGLQRDAAEQEQTETLKKNLLIQALTNPNFPRILASAEGQDATSGLGVGQDPIIQGLMEKGQKANAALEPPTVQEIPTSEEPLPGSGPVVSIPAPPASLKAVNEDIEQENTVKALQLKEAERKAQLANDLLKARIEQRIKDGQKVTFKDQQALAEEIAKAVGGDAMVNWSVDKAQNVSFSVRRPNPSEKADRATRLNQNDYYRGVIDRSNLRRTALVHAQEILKGNLAGVSYEASVDPEQSPAGKQTGDLLAQYLKPENKKKISALPPWAQVNAYLKEVNAAIALGNAINKKRGQGVIADKEIADNETKPLEFEHVSDGTSLADYMKKAGAPMPKIEEVQEPKDKEPAPKSGVGLPAGPAKAGDDKESAAKIGSAYTGVSTVITSARKKNPAMTDKDIETALGEFKDGIMQQFKLSQKEFDQLVKLVKAGAKK